MYDCITLSDPLIYVHPRTILLNKKLESCQILQNFWVLMKSVAIKDYEVLIEHQYPDLCSP